MPATDIEELKRVSDKLAASEAQLRIALDHMPGGMLMLDKNLETLLVNERYIELFEYPDGLVETGKFIGDMLQFQIARGDVWSEPEPYFAIAGTTAMKRTFPAERSSR